MFQDRKLICFLLAAIFAACSCSTVKYVPTETKIETVYRDSVRIKDSTVVTIIPKERVVDIVPVYDTLKMATSTAESKSWVDTSLRCLRGQIEAKNRQESKIIYKEKIQYRDTVITKEIPVPFKVEVEKKYIPNIFKFSFIYLIMSLLFIFYRIYKHFRK